MFTQPSPLFALAVGALVTGLFTQSVVRGQRTTNPRDSDWPMYRHDLAGTGYSPLKQIDATNVTKLTLGWTYHLQGDVPPVSTATGAPTALNSQATPIVVNGRMYLPAANRVVALDPQTGREIWRYSVTGGAPSQRGVAYWSGGGADRPRIIFTAGRRLIAITADTGTLASGFGREGEVDMGVPNDSVPLVYKNVIVVGATPPPATPGPGNAKAFDVRSGRKVWEFSSIPPPGGVGHDTWEGESWKGRFGGNAWTFYFTVDEQRGLVYLTLASPLPTPYGGDRKGANLFANSVVAVDVQTGTYKWHFQTTHHDLWDTEAPAPPALFDMRRNGRTIPALGLATKSGYLYILNRETGEPIFGVEERPVPASDAPGELAFPTQPFPVKPPPLARVEFKPADVVTAADTTPEHARACAELIEKIGGVSNAGPFTPWRYRAEGSVTPSTLVFPGVFGGANRGGLAFDRNSGYILVVTRDVGALGSIEKAKDGSPVPYVRTSPGRSTFDVRIGDRNWPCQKPPWGRLTAVNSSSGDIVWQRPLGISEELPEGKQNTGRPALASAIVTAGGLVFVAGTDDNRFRALDAKTGKELWATKLARAGNGDPMTYRVSNGKQYVVVSAGDLLAAFALP